MTTLLILAAALGASQCLPDQPNDCGIWMAQGGTAPFEGKLLSKRRAARVAIDAKDCKTGDSYRIDMLKGIFDIEIAKQGALRDSDQVASDELADSLRREIARLSPWYKDPWVVSAATLIMAVVAKKALE